MFFKLPSFDRVMLHQAVVMTRPPLRRTGL